MPPFNNDWPCSLFASQDGVAIDAVGIDFLSSEFLAMADQLLSGTFYDPERDGIGLNSFGVLEHWNNAIDKQYSCNLDKSYGIDLVFCQRCFAP